MPPVAIKLESMKLAAKLLCCAHGGGDSFPKDGPVYVEGELSKDWQDLLDLIEKLAKEIEKKLN